MKKLLSEKNYHLLFDVGVVIKGIITLGELVLGVLFYTLSSDAINGIAAFIVGGEGNEQPRDFVWNYFINGVQGITGPAQSFWAFIFLSHGLVKIFLVWGLWKEKLWAYPAGAVVFALFVIYQVYTLIYAWSLFLALITVFDVVLIYLVLHEYNYKRRLRKAL